MITKKEYRELSEHIGRILPLLNEKQKRIFLASEAVSLGYGGVKIIHEISGVSKTTIISGKHEITSGSMMMSDSIRRDGGGRKRISACYPDISKRVMEIVEGSTYGNPENPLSWTTESLRKIQDSLFERYGIRTNHNTVGGILEILEYHKQGNQKMMQVGNAHPDRNEQFGYINAKCKEYLDAGLPVVSVDTKKKENIGNFKNNGQEYRKKGDARRVLDHDFPLKELGKVSPYGVYSLNNNTGFVNVGISHDTSEFAVESISRWWEIVGKHTFPDAKKLYITCDGGGSNSSRSRMWKYHLQQLSDRVGIEIQVSHFPPGTSKWNKVEHRLFCFISKNWQGKPLIDIETVISLIGNTTTKNGLKVVCIKDDKIYALAQSISDEEFAGINIVKDKSLGDWNYTIKPR
jgi:hypothetical protein